MASKCHYSFFYDFTDIIMDAGIYENFNFTKNINTLQDIHTRNVKAAFLVSGGAQIDRCELYNIQSGNDGLYNRVFIEDEKSALEWVSFK